MGSQKKKNQSWLGLGLGEVGSGKCKDEGAAVGRKRAAQLVPWCLDALIAGPGLSHAENLISHIVSQATKHHSVYIFFFSPDSPPASSTTKIIVRAARRPSFLSSSHIPPFGHALDIAQD